MTSLLLAPHADDETLFAAYTCIARKPDIVVCFPDFTDGYRRRSELVAASTLLGCQASQLSYDDPDLMEAYLKLLTPTYDEVIAPAWEEEGHEEHNAIAELADKLFGKKITTRYLTYSPRGQRSREGTEVTPEPWMIGLKLRALGSYVSQIENPLTRPWFFDLLDLREWIA